jgi:hypothetical protein
MLEHRFNIPGRHPNARRTSATTENEDPAHAHSRISKTPHVGTHTQHGLLLSAPACATRLRYGAPSVPLRPDSTRILPPHGPRPHCCPSIATASASASASYGTSAVFSAPVCFHSRLNLRRLGTRASSIAGSRRRSSSEEAGAGQPHDKAHVACMNTGMRWHSPFWAHAAQGMSFASVHAVVGDLTAVGAGECCGSVAAGAGECCGSVDVGASSEAGKVGVGLANFVGGSFEPGAKRDAPFGSLHDRAHFEFIKTGMRSHSPRAAHWAHGTFGASASGPAGTDAIGLKLGLPEVGAPRGAGWASSAAALSAAALSAAALSDAALSAARCS